MTDRFIEDFRSFVEAEASREPNLKTSLGRLIEGLGSVEPLNPDPGSTLPVVREHLGAALDAASGTAGSLLTAVASGLSWAQPYPEHVGEPDMDALRAAYAYAPIVGAVDDGSSPLWSSDAVFAGAVLQGPNVTYPSHVHKAVELYWVASGTARWQKGDEWSTHGPGALIFHDTGVRHATITDDEPTLLLFAWVTDLVSVPVIVRH